MYDMLRLGEAGRRTIFWPLSTPVLNALIMIYVPPVTHWDAMNMSRAKDITSQGRMNSIRQQMLPFRIATQYPLNNF